MDILVASIQLPWPLDSRGKVALYSSLACLRKDHQLTLVCPVYGENGIRDAEELQAQLPEVRIRAINCAATQAVKKHEDIFVRSLRWGARRYRRLRSGRPPQPAEKSDVQRPMYPFAPLPEKFIDAIDAELSRGVDVVQAEFAEMLSLGPWLPKGIAKVFVHHQLHFVYAKRFSKARKLSGYSEYLEKVMSIEEQAYLREFDSIIVFSEEDRRALLEILPDKTVHVSPFPINGEVKETQEDFQNRFVFVGSEDHFPNRDALEWLVTDIWPRILTQLPSSKLKVVGPWGEASKRRFAQPSVEFTGYVDDLGSAIQGSIMLVPLRIGSGIRVKLLDAMSQGIPALSTSVGCEGIPVVDGCEILVRDDVAQFAEAAVELAHNASLRSRLSRGGRSLVNQVYSPERVRQRRNDIYKQLLGVSS